MSTDNRKLIQSYYDSFHSRNIEQFLELLSDDVIHDINQGDRQIGKGAFRAFLEHMNRCYRERLTNLVIMTSGNRAAAEFMVEGTYLTTDPGLPEAKGQHYRLPAGAFFEIEAGQITRISNYYNLTDLASLKTSILAVWCVKPLSAILKYVSILRFSKTTFLPASRG